EVRIGFAGSTSRGGDLRLIAPAIAPILKKYPEAVFEFAGTLPEGIAPSPRIRFFSYDDDYERFVRFQHARGWAIGLAPLTDHLANRCKTDNKYREYGGCGSAPILSNIPPYTDVVQPGVTGLLVANEADAWHAAIERLLAHPQEREAIA